MLHFITRFCSFSFSIIILFLVISFVLSNREPVDIALFPVPYTLSSPLYIMALIMLAVGWISGISLGRMGASKARTALKREKRRAELLDNEVKALRIKQYQEASNAPKLKQKS